MQRSPQSFASLLRPRNGRARASQERSGCDGCQGHRTDNAMHVHWSRHRAAISVRVLAKNRELPTAAWFYPRNSNWSHSRLHRHTWSASAPLNRAGFSALCSMREVAHEKNGPDGNRLLIETAVSYSLVG